jgi:plastocyanin
LSVNDSTGADIAYNNTTAYDSAAMRFWRFRHDSVAGVVRAQYAATAAGPWSNGSHTGITPPAGMDLRRVRLEINTWGKGTNIPPRFAQWDHLNSNAPTPRADFIFSPTEVNVGDTVRLNAAGSRPGGTATIASYAWDFGDMTTGTGMTASRAFTAEGIYPVRLIVTTSAGVSDTTTITLTVGTGPAMLPLSDNFDDNSLDATKWTTRTVGTGATIAETGGRTTVTFASNNGTIGVYRASASTFNFTHRAVYLEAAPLSAVAGARTELLVEGDASNRVTLYRDGTSLVMTQTVGGSTTTVGSVTYNAVNHRFWRLAHDNTTNKIMAQTSSTPTGWTTVAEATPGFGLTSTRIVFGGATYTRVTGPGTSSLDKLNTEYR